ncbi:MAG: VOC family protein [Pseudomonadota bacterium]|nr:VOC family protein [Pseudomonadota bacterium]
MSKVPEGFTSVTPTLMVNGAAEAIDLYDKALGAKELYRMNCPQSGKVLHACVQIGSSRVFLSDANVEKGCIATSSNFYLFVDDVDAAFQKAKQSGLTERSAPEDMFWGDRVSNLQDRFGNNWTLAQRVREVSPQELEEAVRKMSAKTAA